MSVTSILMIRRRSPDFGASLRESGGRLLECALSMGRPRRASPVLRSRDGAYLCSPAPGEHACACSPPTDRSSASTPNGDRPTIEGWIAFPTAIADGTASGTVFLESGGQAGLGSR